MREDKEDTKKGPFGSEEESLAEADSLAAAREAKMIRQDINPTLSNESSSAASSSGKFALGFSGLSNPRRHIQEKALKSSFDHAQY